MSAKFPRGGGGGGSRTFFSSKSNKDHFCQIILILDQAGQIHLCNLGRGHHEEYFC